jgi:hypothetical protein
VTTQPSLAPAAFAPKWRGATTTQKASAQDSSTRRRRRFEGEAAGSVHALVRLDARAGRKSRIAT